ncbi:disulfide bond formation protein B [Jannaschia sp.]|nr:disulfide bond formation protein B [Jannaschia sp.]
MTRQAYIAAATVGHLGLLGGAFLFQAAGYAPCAMCLWQRWPHAAAILLGIVALAGIAPRGMAVLGGLAALTTAGIGAFHAGVEQGWWEGPSSCTGGGDLSGFSGADLLSTQIADTVVMCDEIAWQFGLSMAGWNAVFSLGLAVIWGLAARRI